MTDLDCFLPPVFSGNFPARAAYQVASLPRVGAKEMIPSRENSVQPEPEPSIPILFSLSPQGGLVEVEAVAVVGPLSDLWASSHLAGWNKLASEYSG